jgi:hypothetical protein
MRWTCAVLTAAALVAGCEGGPPSLDDSRRRSIIVGASEVRVHGTSESIAEVQDLEVLPNGEVWVLNSIEPLFVGFDAEGRVIREHGRVGGGPEEFGGPSGFVIGGVEGQPWVFDRRRHALFQVSGPDSARAEIPLPANSIPPGSLLPGIRLGWSDLVRTARLGDELLLPRRAGPSEGGVYSLWLGVWTADILAMDPETESVRNAVALGEVLDDPTPHFDVTDAFLPFPLWFRLWAVCADEIRVYDRLRHQVRRFTPEGSELDSIALPPASLTSVTADAYARALFPLAVIEAAPSVPASGEIEISAEDSAMVVQGLLSRITAPPERLANLLPRYTDLRCDEQGTLWLQPFDIDEGGLDGGPVWLRIADDGEVQEVRLPDRFDPYRFTAERIWGVQRNELDVASVAWIPTPPSD